jgi:hypothetical protein
MSTIGQQVHTLATKSVQELIDLIDRDKDKGKGKDKDKEKKIGTGTENASKSMHSDNPIDKIYDVVDKVDTAIIKHPDLVLLAEIGIVVCIGIIIYMVWPYLTANNNPIFSLADLQKAKNLPSTAFSVAEITKIKTELSSIEEYLKFFASSPYSMKSQGLDDLARGVVFLPIIAFVGGFIIPPIIIAYILWFVIKYWKAVIEGLWGWFLMLYEYGTHLIEGKLGCKWYISFVTGWGCGSPNFETYFDEWRRKYIEVPSYHEKLAYVDKYQSGKAKYLTIPKLKYFDTPKDEIVANLEYVKETAINRAGNAFTKNLIKFHKNFYEKPRDQIYRWLIEDSNAKPLPAPDNNGKSLTKSNKFSVLQKVLCTIALIIISAVLIYVVMTNYYPAQLQSLTQSVSKINTSILHPNLNLNSV